MHSGVPIKIGRVGMSIGLAVWCWHWNVKNAESDVLFWSNALDPGPTSSGLSQKAAEPRAGLGVTYTSNSKVSLLEFVFPSVRWVPMVSFS